MSNIRDESSSEIKQRLLNNMTSDLYKGEGSDLSNISGAIALELSANQAQVKYVVDAFFGKVLDELFVERARSFGVARKEGIKAFGSIRVYATEGTVIPKETLILTSTNREYLTQFEIIINNLGYGDVDIVAMEIGSEFNTIENSLRLGKTVNGVIRIENQPIINGVNQESLESLYERFSDRLQKPPSTGNKADYRRWAKEVTGVYDALVVPLANGNGTVKVICYGENGTQVDQIVLDNVLIHINEYCPIGATVEACSVSEVEVTLTVSNLIAEDGYSLNTVKEKVEYQLKQYIDSIYPGDTLILNKVTAQISLVHGVYDFEEILLNGLNENLISTTSEKLRLLQVVFL